LVQITILHLPGIMLIGSDHSLHKAHSGLFVTNHRNSLYQYSFLCGYELLVFFHCLFSRNKLSTGTLFDIRLTTCNTELFVLNPDDFNQFPSHLERGYLITFLTVTHGPIRFKALSAQIQIHVAHD